MRHDTASTISKRNMAVIMLLIALITAMLVPVDAFAQQTAGAGVGNASSSCAVQAGKQIDYSTCLPSGRWGGLVGQITSRIEPAGGITGPISNIMSTVTTSMRQVLPNMFLMIAQVCWSSALSLSQFAASFTPLQTAGAQLDHATAQLIDDLMAGGIPAALVVMAIFGVIGAAGFDIGTTKEAGKRLIATVLCLSALIVLGNGAARTGEKATSPAAGSPWWVVKTINDTVNTITIGLNLDGMNDTNDQMMAYNHNFKNPNCQDYLYQMHEQYKHSGAEEDGKETSAVTSAVNRLWEETALRNWVTMQWNNPTAAGSVTPKQAANAQQAYCHILDLENGTSTDVQKTLTNASLGTRIDDQTAKWIFTYNGWISTYNSVVDDGKAQDDRDNSVRATRAAVFWETCSTDNKDVIARKGWSKIINNIGDGGTGAIKNNKKSIRAAIDGSSLKDVEPTYPDSLMHAASDGGDDSTNAAVQHLCNTVFHDQGVFHRKSDGYGAGDKQNDTNVGDAATLGWRFDVPNLGATWREANAGSINDPSTDPGAAHSTLDYLYGNITPDTIGAFGSVIGGLCNMIVWGALSLILIISKLMMCLMVIFLAAAFLVRAVPFGEAPKKVLGNWAKLTLNLSMTGTLYAILGTIATFICQLALKFTSGMTSTFVYNIISGISPVLAMIIIGMFCSKIAKWGNPFSIKGMMSVAGGSALSAGAFAGLSRGMRMMRNMNSNVRNRVAGATRPDGRMSSTHSGSNASGATASQNIVDRVSEQQSPMPGVRGRHSMPRGVAAKWAAMDPDTVRGSLAATAAKVGQHGLGIKNAWTDPFDEDAYRRKHRDAFLPHVAGMDNAVKARRLLHNLARLPKSGGHIIGAGASAVKGALMSKPLRNVALRTATVAAVAGAGALAFSNPITGPLGLAAMGKLAATRDVWHGAKVGLGVAKTAMNHVGDAAGSYLHAYRAQFHTANGIPQAGSGSGAGDAATEVLPVVDNPFDLAGQRMHTPDGVLTPDGQRAFDTVRKGMMDDYVNNQHMSQAEAEDAFQRDTVNGAVKEQATRFFAENIMPYQNDAAPTRTMPPVQGDGGTRSA